MTPEYLTKEKFCALFRRYTNNFPFHKSVLLEHLKISDSTYYKYRNGNSAPNFGNEREEVLSIVEQYFLKKFR